MIGRGHQTLQGAARALGPPLATGLAQMHIGYSIHSLGI